MARSDFAWVNFDQDFNSSNEAASRTFRIEGTPTGTGYLLIQHYDVENNNHRISINGQELPSFDMAARDPQLGNRIWVLWMDRIPPGFLQQGLNRIDIERGSTEFFHVANIAVHWREPG